MLVADLEDETILLESGLDSMGFAILVAQLEIDLDLDPFMLMAEPVYAQTFGGSIILEMMRRRL